MSEVSYTADRIARMRQSYQQHGVTYLDWRVGITTDGDWLYFVAGD